MQEVSLDFRTEDAGLNLMGTVNFPERVQVSFSTLSIRGLAEWRHVPSNVVHLSRETAQAFGLIDPEGNAVPEKTKPLSKIGMNWIGIKARTDILLSHAVRKGRNGTKKVQEQLTKFFKAMGASSVKFSIIEPENELDDGGSDLYD